MHSMWVRVMLGHLTVLRNLIFHTVQQFLAPQCKHVQVSVVSDHFCEMLAASETTNEAS